MPSTDAYDAFGTRISQSVYSQPDPWGFGAQEGYYTDTAQSGLILCTHRYYDPAKGRFLTRDPLGYGGGVNLYGYTGNNPVNESDPRGLSTYGGGLNGTITFGPIVVGISGGFKGDDNGTVGLSCNVFTVCRFPPGLPGVSPAVNYSPGNLPVDGNGITSISGGLSSGPVVYLPPVGIVNSTPCSGGPPTISVFPGVQSPGIGYVVSAGGTVGINGNGLENTVNQGIGQWYGPGWFGDSGE